MVKRITSSRPVQVVMAYGQSQGGNYAASLAYNGFLSMFPLILGMLSIVGFLITDPATQKTIYADIVSVFPGDAHAQILRALVNVKHNAGLLGILAVLGLLWSGTGLFASMEFALTEIFGTKQRDMLRQRLMGIIMMLVFIAAVLFVVAANSALAASAGAGILGTAAGAIVLVGLMIAIYRFVPNRTFALKDIWPGAVLAGVMIELFSLLFPLYAKVSNGFGTYGQQFALFFLLATWLGFLCQFILLGAVFNKMRLGVPNKEGIVASPAAASRAHKAPGDAIDEQKRQPHMRDQSAGPQSTIAAGDSRPGAFKVGMALGACIGAATIGTLALRFRASSGATVRR